jgi:hypothetical protein
MPDNQEDFELSRCRAIFEKGDSAGLIECVILCSRCEIPLPDWARDAVARAFADWEEEPGRTMESCLGLRGGRHTRVTTKLRDRENQKKVVAAVQRAKNQGLSGEPVYEEARKLLSRIGAAANKDSIKSRYFRYRAKFPNLGPDSSLRELDRILRPICTKN